MSGGRLARDAKDQASNVLEIPISGSDMAQIQGILFEQCPIHYLNRR